MANTESAGLTADAPPVRYRVSGMDCAKDAAQIERAAQSAGVAPGDVKVSAATHIMTLNGRCCTTLTVEDSQRESMRLDGLHEQAIPRPLPHDKLVQLHCLALQARFAVDLAGQGHDLALAA